MPHVGPALMPASTVDRLIMGGCLFLMSFGLRLIQLGNHLRLAGDADTGDPA